MLFKLTTRTVIIALSVLAIVLLGIPLTHVFRKWIGPIQNVGNYNAELTDIARTATPIIQKIDEYHSSTGKFPSIEEVRELVHDPRLPSNGNSDYGDSIVYPRLNSSGVEEGWSYVPLSINDQIVGFYLRDDFSMSELLTYKYMDGKGEWIYLVNETNEKVVKLKP